MSIWPSNLPPPLRTVEIRPGRNAQAITQASGRRIVRNWGHRPADQVTVQFRIHVDDEPAFNYFWHRTGMDMTWFTADWLTSMGYTDHKARIVGYPRRKGITGKWMDFAVTLLVQASSLCVNSKPWPSVGAGSSSGPSPGTEGDVVGWGYNYSSIITNMPAGLRGTKVDCSSYPRSSDPGSGKRGVYIGALQTDGTIIFWGCSTETWVSDIATLSGVVDFLFVRAYSGAGMYYINSSGYISHLGTPPMGVNYPTNSGFTKLYNHHTWAFAENENGSCYYWNGTASGTLFGVTAPLKHATFGWASGSSPSGGAASKFSTLIVDATGEVSVWQTYLGNSAPSRNTAVEPTINSGIICGCHGASGCMVCYDDFSWWGYDETKESFTDIPAGLEPTWARTFRDDSSTLALHTDGRVIGWGTDRYGTINNIPANLKAHQMCVKTVLIDYQTAFAIKIDD